MGSPTDSLAVGQSLFPWGLGAKGTAAAAGGFGLRILNGKSGTLHAVNVIHLGAGQERSALGIQDDFDAALFNDRVLITRLRLKRHAVLVPMAPAALHVDTQPDRVLLLFQQLPDFLLGFLADRHHLSAPPFPFYLSLSELVIVPLVVSPHFCNGTRTTISPFTRAWQPRRCKASIRFSRSSRSCSSKSISDRCSPPH